jgi:hypothetical protein
MCETNGSEEFADALVEQPAADAEAVNGQLYRPYFYGKGCESFRSPNVACLVKSSLEESLFDVNHAQIHSLLGDDGLNNFYIFQL